MNAKQIRESINAFVECKYKTAIELNKPFACLPDGVRTDLIARAARVAQKAALAGDTVAAMEALQRSATYAEWQSDIKAKAVEIERKEDGSMRILRKGKPVPVDKWEQTQYEAEVDFNNPLWPAKAKVDRLYMEARRIMEAILPIIAEAEERDKEAVKAKAKATREAKAKEEAKKAAARKEAEAILAKRQTTKE